MRDRKGEYRKEFLELRKQGFQRVKVNGAFHDLEAPPTGAGQEVPPQHRRGGRPDHRQAEGIETRLADSFTTALGLADGIAVIETATEEPERTVFSEKFACPVSVQAMGTHDREARWTHVLAG